MSQDSPLPPDTAPAASSISNEPQLERGTYEIIQARLKSHAEDLRRRLGQLNQQRREVFGSIPTELLSTQRITTAHNCTARDMVAIGDRFLFGYNVHLGLKTVTELADVFGVYRFADGTMHQQSLELLEDPAFVTDFVGLYKYYKDTRFQRFYQSGPHLYFVFQVGNTPADTKSFKFLILDGGLKYIDNRSDHEVRFPPQHDFQWIRTHRDLHRDGRHPHVSIEDRVFVETVGGDLTIKVEDNTDDGSGIYAEPVDDPDQTLDDAEYFYAIVGNLILLRIRPFKETRYRHLVFNEKTQTARRLDSIKDACVFLPEDHGLIFANGYYLQTGVEKTFESDLSDLRFERRIASSNGEDYLYVFYSPSSGNRILLSYNMIEQEVATPIVCSGFSLFDNGQLIYFRSDATPQKHHAMQVWQTPYVGEDYPLGEQTDSYIFKIGNRDIVRAMSEAHELLNLIGQQDSYANLYVDLVKKSTDVLDTYFWLADPQTGELAKPLTLIRDAATAAVDEYDKVVRVRKNTRQQFEETSAAATDAVLKATSRHFSQIDDFVRSLAELRQVRGRVISLRELKYVDLDAVGQLETKVAENTDRLSKRCVEYLLREDSLLPYRQRVETQQAAIAELATGVAARELDQQIAQGSGELEMLIEIVSNLKIDDATQRTRIIDNISAIYSSLNQTRATLKKRTQELLSVEGAAEFNSQLKLISQAVVNYLDVCETPQQCDEYLTKMMVQVEELEGKFAEFDEFIIQLAEKRDEIYAAFDTRKLQLIEARNKRATALMQAADRIIKGIRSRVANFGSVDEINSYFASDLMIDKVRDIVDQLAGMEESVKVDDIQSRLKTVREDTVRQLRDKQELYVDGQNIIQFGPHKFSVNTQPLDLTTVVKEDQLFFHLSGTNYFEPVRHAPLLATVQVWDQPIVSENREVYRAEYLAYLVWKSITEGTLEAPADEEASRLQLVRTFMAPRYAEGYVKGVHDQDAARILQPLLKLDRELGLLRYSTQARTAASLGWYCWRLLAPQDHAAWTEKLEALREPHEVLGNLVDRAHYVDQLRDRLATHLATSGLDQPQWLQQAAEYLWDQQLAGGPWVASSEARELIDELQRYLKKQRASERLERSLAAPSLDPLSRFGVAQQWMRARSQQQSLDPPFADEAAVMLVDGTLETRLVSAQLPTAEVTGLLGDHPRIDGSTYHFDYHDFLARLRRFEAETVPAYQAYVHLKKEVVDRRREELRLDEFKPRVLTSFVRNRLINDTYLPLVGANLAKQIGVVGEDKRTDLMGLLLLVSPPGYGKTTLMEYIANRLGITFMKINGPAIGHQVTSLDPAEAPNASAREEVEKLNLALEMGDNVMIYLDDIQHCNPEFLQKFISLCDATRRIEGVFGGRTRTYDLRGRKVAVVMAGNPYTESGEKFQIPDMLASRADTYNLGDVIGSKRDSFELSYLENCLTSNATLAKLNSRSQQDVYAVIEMAQRGDDQPQTLQGNYSVEEINDFVAVMRKLLTARDVILRVNREYIDSAAQADEYRTEPPFKLQGSYRDMNKIAEQLSPIMNDEELQAVIEGHYLNQAQTLTSDAQANLLKLKELMGTLAGEERQRWEDIRRTFQRNLMLGAAGDDSQLGQLIAQLTTFGEGLFQIRSSLDKGIQQWSGRPENESSLQASTLQHVSRAVSELSRLNDTVGQLREALPATAQPDRQARIEVINKVPNLFLDIIRNQFRVMQTWMGPILKLAETYPEAAGLQDAARATEENYDRLMKQIGEPPSTPAGPEEAIESDELPPGDAE